MSAISTEKIVRWYREGDSLAVIAERTGMSKQGIANRLEAAGVQRRTYNEIQRNLYAEWAVRNAARAVHDVLDTEDERLVADKYDVPLTWIRRAVRESSVAKLLGLRHTSLESRWSDHDMVRALRRAAKHFPDSPLSTSRYTSVRGPDDPSAASIVTRYGKWSRALDAAKVTGYPATRDYPTVWTLDAARSALRSFFDHCREHDVEPSLKTYNDGYRLEHDAPSEGTIRELFGTWRHAMFEAARR